MPGRVNERLVTLDKRDDIEQPDSGHGAPIFTRDLRLQRFGCDLAGALRHVAGFPVLGLRRPLRPTP
ncbi:MAG: hypothetical protein M3256_04635, partial [Actinomycetota bacterium]|nr:hypothetical protein [Actinomycetota bacterium]